MTRLLCHRQAQPVLRHAPSTPPRTKARARLRLLWIAACAGMTVLSACGIKGNLTRPSDIEQKDKQETTNHSPSPRDANASRSAALGGRAG